MGHNSAAAVVLGQCDPALRVEPQHKGVLRADLRERRRRQVTTVESPAQIGIARAVNREAPGNHRGPGAAKILGVRGGAARVDPKRVRVLRADLRERRVRQVIQGESPAHICVVPPRHREASEVGGCIAATVVPRPAGRTRRGELHQKPVLNSFLRERRRRHICPGERPAQSHDGACRVYRDGLGFDRGPAAAEVFCPRDRAVRRREFHRKSVLGADLGERRDRQARIVK